MENPANPATEAGVAFRLRREPVDFCDNRLSEALSYPRSSADGLFFDDKLDRYDVKGIQATASVNTIQITTEMEKQRVSFESAVGEYKAKLTSNPKYMLKFDAERLTWTELLDDVDKCRARYLLKEKTGIQDYIRDFARGIGRWEGSVAAWLGLLPADALETAALIGGLKLIFGAARRLDITREDAKNVLEQIPVTIYKAHSLTRSYDSQRLQACASQVYVAVLEALEHILRYFKEKAFAKFFKAIVLTDQYKLAMKTSFSKLQELEKRLDAQGILDLHGCAADIRQNGEEDLQIGKKILQMTTAQTKILSVWNSSLQMFDDALRKIENELRLKRIKEQEDERSRKELKFQKKANRQDSAHRLCESLDYDHELIYSDMERVIHNGFSTGNKDRNRVVYLFQQAEEVREWLQPGQSQVLVINSMGNALDAISSTSIFCAMLSHGIGEADGVVVLRWFCGLHTTDEGVPAMLRNLIGQVLMHVSTAVDLSEHGTVFFNNHRNCEDPDKLLDLLVGFIRQQLKYTPVVVLLDGASFLENKTYFRDMHRTVQRLLSLVDGKDGCEFKLLLTSPIRVMELLSRSDRAVVLNVPPWVDGVTFAACQSDLFKDCSVAGKRTR